MTDFKFLHCHFFFEKIPFTCLHQLSYWAIVREHFFKHEHIQNRIIFELQSIWGGGVVSTSCSSMNSESHLMRLYYCTLSPLPSPTPVWTLPVFNWNVLKTGASRSSLALARIVCVLSSLLDPVGTWSYFFRREYKFAFLTILSGPLCDVCERN